VPVIAALTLPSVVLTHLNGDHWVARLPLPVTIAVCYSGGEVACTITSATMVVALSTLFH
jgi:hypothetical protein